MRTYNSSKLKFDIFNLFTIDGYCCAVILREIERDREIIKILTCIPKHSLSDLAPLCAVVFPSGHIRQ